MAKPKVVLVKFSERPDEKEIRRAIESIFNKLQVEEKSVKDKTIIIKPNVVVAAEPESGAVTDPVLCKVIADLLGELGAEPIIAESSAVGVDTEKAFEKAGYLKLRELGYKVLDLKKDEKVKVRIPNGKELKEIELPKTVVEADFVISVPKMKTHDQALVTLSMKNLKGLIPDKFKRAFHTDYGVFSAVVDLCKVVRSEIQIVDGIIAQEGYGPIFGTPVEMNLIIGGNNLVATDAVAAYVMGFNPKDDEIIRIATEEGLGPSDLDDIEIVGDVAAVRRKFKSADEAISEILEFPPGFELVFNERACTGCRNTVLSALMDAKAENMLDRIRDVVVVAGKIEDKFDVDKYGGKKVVVIGKCNREFKDLGTYVKGCPPNNRDILSALVGEERGARYWE